MFITHVVSDEYMAASCMNLSTQQHRIMSMPIVNDPSRSFNNWLYDCLCKILFKLQLKGKQL